MNPPFALQQSLSELLGDAQLVVTDLPDTSLESEDGWRLVIDVPFGEPGHGPRDGIGRLQQFRHARDPQRGGRGDGAHATQSGRGDRLEA